MRADEENARMIGSALKQFPIITGQRYRCDGTMGLEMEADHATAWAMIFHSSNNVPRSLSL